MIVKTVGRSVSRTSWQKTFPVKCPACSSLGTFGFVGGSPSSTEIAVRDIAAPGSNTLFHGARQCPNTSCGCIITFWAYSDNDSSLVTWPSFRASFDREFVPERVVNAFREALECEANNLYVASAILLRKTMEEICGDQRADGKDLRQRIDTLLSQGNISSKLRDTLHEIRYLGNDAAHLESTIFQKVGREECNVAIQIVKETIKQLYQTGHLKAQMDALKGTKD